MPYTMNEAEAVIATTKAIAGALRVIHEARARVSTIRSIAHPNRMVKSCHSVLTVGVTQLEDLRDMLSHQATDDEAPAR
jgi:hypothetical protein